MFVDIGLAALNLAALNFLSAILWFVAAISVCIISVAGWVIYGHIFGSGVSSDNINKAAIWGAAAFVVGLLAVQGIISINEKVNKQDDTPEKIEGNPFTR